MFSCNFSYLVTPQIIPFNFGNEDVNTGDSVSAACSIIKGDIPVNIKWLHGNLTVINGDGVTITRVSKKLSTLSIDSVQEQHIGNYTCVASNKGGRTSHSTYLHVNGIYI